MLPWLKKRVFESSMGCYEWIIEYLRSIIVYYCSILYVVIMTLKHTQTYCNNSSSIKPHWTSAFRLELWSWGETLKAKKDQVAADKLYRLDVGGKFDWKWSQVTKVWGKRMQIYLLFLAYWILHHPKKRCEHVGNTGINWPQLVTSAFFLPTIGRFHFQAKLDRAQ